MDLASVLVPNFLGLKDTKILLYFWLKKMHYQDLCFSLQQPNMDLDLASWGLCLHARPHCHLNCTILATDTFPTGIILRLIIY